MASVTHSTLTRRTQTLHTGRLLTRGTQIQKRQVNKWRNQSRGGTSNFVHSNLSFEFHTCASRRPPNSKYAADDQTRGQFPSVKHITLSDVGWNIQAAGRGGQRGGTASPRFHRLESPSSPDAYIMTTILTLLWHNACSKKKKKKEEIQKIKPQKSPYPLMHCCWELIYAAG